EGPLHLLGQIDVLDALVDGLGWRGLWHGLPAGRSGWTRDDAPDTARRWDACERLTRMPLMLPSSLESTRNIAGVAPQLLASLRGAGTDLAPARSVVLVVVDGLGAIPLRAHAGHARTLASAMAKKDVAGSVFPTTTAAALTSLVTGAAPGTHGMVGYRVLNPARGVLVNQLTEWESAGVDPLVWQSAPTLFEQATAAGQPAFVVGFPAYAGTGFTRAILRGAEFR